MVVRDMHMHLMQKSLVYMSLLVFMKAVNPGLRQKQQDLKYIQQQKQQKKQILL